MYEYLDRRYALALYEVAEEKGKVEIFLDDLRQIVKVFDNDEDFLKIMKHPEISIARKKKLFIKIFKGKIDDDLLSFLLILIEKDRILFLKEKLVEMEKIHLDRNNTLLAHVKTVIPLDESQKKQLISSLEKKYDKKVILKEEIDKSVIGGVYVRVGDDVIDGTLKSKLQEMKKLMLKRE
ncbi:F0F1 ATP synthase subunit delta [Clostridium sp. JN-9]|mgnify:CR=1 FL=1|uniref:F0F1 ATP synthase subunit delta n=1 Tax=Clostridium sp. JN-9 TaxID=2507159 RepID=UPI000FFDFB3D|nr:F0F1 ATP synthase subunit delta [Clostridium sp. JN-9]QAT38985.1 F0F1 ATP synthase subunit delta [Clostridium sp. JN-9]